MMKVNMMWMSCHGVTFFLDEIMRTKPRSNFVLAATEDYLNSTACDIHKFALTMFHVRDEYLSGLPKSPNGSCFSLNFTDLLFK